MPESSKQSTASLVGIYAALIALLLATLLANQLPLGPFSLVVALLIAISKAILVILFFMHVRFAGKVTWLFVACGFLWLGILFSLTFSDYLTRSWTSRADDITTSAQRSSSQAGQPHASSDPTLPLP